MPLCYPLFPPHTSQTLPHCLLFMELFHHVFLHAYYRGLPYESGMARMKHLNNLLPPVCFAFRKFFLTKSQNYSCYLHLQEWRRKDGQSQKEPNLNIPGCRIFFFHSYFISLHLSFFFFYFLHISLFALSLQCNFFMYCC